jgi:hypothetical protein
MLIDKTVNNNGIGSMFMLKAKYGYRETAELIISSDDSTPKIDAEQLDLLADSTGSPAELPKM